MAQLKNTSISDTGFLRLPSGNTAQRPTPASAQLRYNSSIGRIEQYNADIANWADVAYLNVSAAGGNSVYEIEAEGTTYRVHVFTSTGNSNFVVSKGGEVEYLIVGGGGGGSGNFYDDGAGGGGGGLIAGKTTVTPQTYTITVGGGGARSGGGAGSQGENSVAFGLTALGGGGGASHRSSAPGGGGSGGGGGGSFLNDGLNVAGGPAAQPGSASGGFGNRGGNGGINNTLQGGGYPGSGGGGGAGSEGNWPLGGGRNQGGHGGTGLAFNITGTNNFYAGGGGGLLDGLGGIGGGANASGGRGTTAARDATPNTGGGGGGGRQGENDPGQPSNGGSGIVVIRYQVRQKGLVSSTRETLVDSSLIVDFNFFKTNSYGNTSFVYDTAGTATIGVLVNGPPVQDFGTHRGNLRFNGSSQHLRLETFNNRPSSQITYEAWVYPDRAVTTGTRRGAIWSNSATTYIGIFDSNDGGATHGLHWALQTSNSRSGSNNGSIPNRAWSHIVGTYDGTNTRGYVNGVLVYNVAQSGTVSDGTYYVGTYGNAVNDTTHNWEGNISQARMYTRALTQAEIQANFNFNRWRFGV